MTSARGMLNEKNLKNDCVDHLTDIINSELFYKHTIWPSDKVSPEALGTTCENADSLDNLTDIIRRA